MRGIGGELDGTKRNVMHVQMVRVAVETLRTECEDDVRADRADVRCELGGDGLDGRANECPRMLGAEGDPSIPESR